MTREGVDWSTGIPGSTALKAAGKSFAGRYAVTDKSPSGRGIGADEYAELAAGGVDVFLYWESSEGWMEGGWNAGVFAAQNAQANIVGAGIPETAAVYFACDFDASDDQMPAILDCLKGAESVIGRARVGFYAGYGPIDFCMRSGYPVYFCQTLAWEYGRGLHPAAHLYQYGFNAYINGVNCDLVRSYKEDFGQVPRPATVKPTIYAVSDLPEWWNEQLASPTPHDETFNGVHWLAIRRNVVALAKTFRYSKPDIKSPRSGPAIATRDKLLIERAGTVKNADGKNQDWFLTHDGDYIFAGRFSPKISIHHR